MSEESTNPTSDDNMLDHYDFSNGVRGKHFKEMQNGYSVTIHNEDGTSETVIHKPIFLDNEVAKYFPDSESVNKALRGLIDLIPS